MTLTMNGVTPQGVYTITIQGTDGTLTHTTTLSLNVVVMPAGRNQLIGGGFRDVFQNRLVNGFLVLTLIEGTFSYTNPTTHPTDGYLFENAGSTPSTFPLADICGGISIKVPLDQNGNVSTATQILIYTNDTLFPFGSYYMVACYSSRGELVWGPNAQTILSSPVPFDCGAWVPNEIQ
jgi:hypothetical protein